ncbi:MAG: diguanylate cyclase [Methylococcales bacterium]|nr:diguanylate cyclase [Methylococcales bacterium]
MSEALTILLLEDNPDHLELFELFLAMTDYAGAHLSHATRFSEAQALLEHQHVDIAFVDLSLPDSTYGQTLSQLHALPAVCPYVVLTSLADNDTMLTVVDHGADDCLNKTDLNDVTLARVIHYNLSRWQLRYELAQEKQRLADIIEATQVGTWEWNLETHQIDINARWAQMLGYTRQELQPLTMATRRDLMHPDDWSVIDDKLQSIYQHEQAYYQCELRFRHKKGHWVWVSSRGKVMDWNTDGTPLRVVGTHSDISAQKHAMLKLQQAAKVFTDTHEGIVITDADARIIDVNPAFCRVTGYAREEAIGQNPRLLKSGHHDALFYELLWQQLLAKGFWRGEIWNRNKNGDLYAELLTISAIYDEHKQIQQFVGLLTDITQFKEHEQQLEWLAHYDPLTKLPNRTLLADRFRQALAQAQRQFSLLAVGFLDLDGFKPVNDRYGHEVGDLLLIEVAERITQVVREGDTVCRQGGDEFVILLVNLSTVEQCRQIINRIHQQLAEPFQIHQDVIHIGASSGWALYPETPGDLDALLDQADQAMYQAKAAGKNQYHFFDLDD